MQTATVLIVEDHDPLRMFIMEELVQHGYRVFPAVGALSALEHLAQHNIDIILTDYRIPSIDGALWLMFLNRFLHTAKLGVMSSYAVNTHGLPFLKKPFSGEKLVDFVSSLAQDLNSIPRVEAAN